MLSQFHVVPSVFPIRRRADPVGPRSFDRWRLTTLDLKLLALMSTILSTIMLARIGELVFFGENHANSAAFNRRLIAIVT
jgi:hypothetical protein